MIILIIKLFTLGCVAWCIYRGYVHGKAAYDKYKASKEEKKS